VHVFYYVDPQMVECRMCIAWLTNFSVSSVFTFMHDDDDGNSNKTEEEEKKTTTKRCCQRGGQRKKTEKPRIKQNERTS